MKIQKQKLWLPPKKTKQNLSFSRLFCMFIRVCLIIIFTYCSCTAKAQVVPIYSSYQDFMKDNISSSDTTYIVNFWATWCAPCIKELPYFDSFVTKNKNKKVKVLLVSLDFKNQLESHLKPYLRKHRLKANTSLLTDKNYNHWLGLVDENWSGSIPATLLIHNGKKAFAEREFDSEKELSSFVYSFISSL